VQRIEIMARQQSPVQKGADARVGRLGAESFQG
jgi:hypothetical protein